ncbi:MAG: hypothetical protein AAGJ32_13310 [Pseudomonadota bacterium]
MINDPMFLRHKDVVWPVFWPFFLWACGRFHRVAEALNARGVYIMEITINPWGTIKITRTTWAHDWRHGLYARAGAYDQLAPLVPPRIHDQNPTPDIAALNIIYWRANTMRTALKAWTQTYCDAPQRLATYLSAGLPLPHT